MRRALTLAATTPPHDVPVAALIVNARGQLLASATNLRHTHNDPTSHAEILAIRHAATVNADMIAHQHACGRAETPWRLTHCTLYATLEPCAMCAGAAIGARIGRIVFGAYEPNTGACGSVWDIPRESPLGFTELTGGVLEDECARLLSTFFSTRRTR